MWRILSSDLWVTTYAIVFGPWSWLPDWQLAPSRPEAHPAKDYFEGSVDAQPLEQWVDAHIGCPKESLFAGGVVEPIQCMFLVAETLTASLWHFAS